MGARGRKKIEAAMSDPQVGAEFAQTPINDKNAELTAEQVIRLLQEVAGRHCSHIQKPYTLKEICEHVDGSEYNAELMLQHLLLWCSDYMKLQ